mgnify:CR=1 FL=1
MIKILGIVFQSTVQLNRLALFTDKVESLEEGMARATEVVAREQGLLGWTPIITTMREIVAPLLNTEPVVSVVEIKKGDETTRWLMKTIIINKDTVLFDAAKKYMSEPEILYTKDKINADTIT